MYKFPFHPGISTELCTLRAQSTILLSAHTPSSTQLFEAESTMRMSADYAILVLFLFLLSFRTNAERSRNPCHPNRSSEDLGTKCEFIRLPFSLCSNCRLNGYDSKGYFNRCDAIYDINDPKCRAGLRAYVRLNECDTIRKKQVQNFNSKESQFALDYFVYSICEECCDCVPDGSKSSQYSSRKMSSLLISYVRGNCPAHAHYDVCRVWPNIKDVTRPGEPFKRNSPEICPIIRQWFDSPNSKNWYSNDNTKMDQRIRAFLERLVKAAGCAQKAVWQMCVGLESAQNRV